MTAPALPLCLTASIREQKALRFNERAEVRWFGFQGAFVEPGESVIRLLHREAGAPGGGGSAALTGGLIAAGFDSAAVLVGLGHYESEVVVTLDLSVRFLRLAHADRADQFAARLVKSTRGVAFVEGELRHAARPADPPFATLTTMVAPA